MKVYCKRTYFEVNTNYFKINGKGYGEHYAKWVKEKYYQVRKPFDYEEQLGVYYHIESEKEVIVENSSKKTKIIVWCPIKRSEFNKYFIDVDDLRNNKIDFILWH